MDGANRIRNHESQIIPTLCVLLQAERSTHWDSYLISRMDKFIDSLGEATIFWTVDANCSY